MVASRLFGCSIFYIAGPAYERSSMDLVALSGPSLDRDNSIWRCSGMALVCYCLGICCVRPRNQNFVSGTPGRFLSSLAQSRFWVQTFYCKKLEN